MKSLSGQLQSGARASELRVTRWLLGWLLGWLVGLIYGFRLLLRRHRAQDNRRVD